MTTRLCCPPQWGYIQMRRAYRPDMHRGKWGLWVQFIYEVNWMWSESLPGIQISCLWCRVILRWKHRKGAKAEVCHFLWGFYRRGGANVKPWKKTAAFQHGIKHWNHLRRERFLSMWGSHSFIQPDSEGQDYCHTHTQTLMRTHTVKTVKKSGFS